EKHAFKGGNEASFRYYEKNGSKNEGIKGLEEHKIATWREELQHDGHLKPFAFIRPTDSLYSAVQMLCKEKVHRLPVVEECSGNIAFILTHKRLIKFLYLYVSFELTFSTIFTRCLSHNDLSPMTPAAVLLQVFRIW
ncbi:unnamed protein product, partial [Gongylonema pulchrum]|uniref:CBS domain-containing protein n=1 Tax=Gongylonema pulchrum TaxID=637853 RepID=A0A183DE03_9BILA